MQQKFPDLPDGDDDPEEALFARQYFLGLEEFSSLLQRQISELDNYHNQYRDPREDWNVAMALEAVQASQRRWLDSGAVEGFISVEMSSKLEQQQYLQNSRFVQSVISQRRINMSHNLKEIANQRARSPVFCILELLICSDVIRLIFLVLKQLTSVPIISPMMVSCAFFLVLM